MTDTAGSEDDRTACPACGGPGRDRSYRVEDHQLYRCRLCRTEFLVRGLGEPPAESTYWDGYKFELYGDEAIQEQYTQRYDAVFERLWDRFGRPGSLLDVGCGIGNFLDWARGKGIDASGTELDADALAAARERGLSVWDAEELPNHLAPGSVDVLTLWDVIEHVPDPRAFLASFLGYLRPGGLVVLETPDVSFPVRPAVIAIRKVAEPVRWSDMLYFRDHLVYFSARGLSTLMGRCGLEVVDQTGLRSPSTKMAAIVEQAAERGVGTGRLGPSMYRTLDSVMRSVGMTNKLVMVGRVPGAGPGTIDGSRTS